MELHILNSGSIGNCYILRNKHTALIIECGVSFRDVKIALNFDLSKVAGALVTHEHLDHSKAVDDVLSAGIKVYTSPGTIQALNLKSHGLKPIQPYVATMIGEFKVMPFNAQHNCKQPYGFLIEHPDCGRILFITDSRGLAHKFTGLNNILIEANYCDDIIDQQVMAGKMNNSRTSDHMSIETCKQILKNHDLKAVNNIVLIHLSDANSHALRFKQEVQQLTGKNVQVASKNMILPFKKTPF